MSTKGSSRKFRIIALSIFAGAAWVLPGRAATTAVPISAETNANLRTYNGGTSYPVAPTSLSVGGIGFDLAPLGTAADSVGIVQLMTTEETVTIPTNVANPTTVYTLMNSAWGSNGATIGTVTFVGSGGAIATFDLVEGTNIRDHFNGRFNNIATSVVSATFGNDRLDRQTFTLPSSFANQTLTQIILTGKGTDKAAGTGQPFLAAVTVSTSGTSTGTNPVPAPAAALLCALGSALAAWRFRRRATV
jgi:hypothetical protein